MDALSLVGDDGPKRGSCYKITQHHHYTFCQLVPRAIKQQIYPGHRLGHHQAKPVT